MSFWEKVGNWFGWVKVRARDEDGRYIADDKSTAKNEAYTMVHKDLVAKPKPKRKYKKRKKVEEVSKKSKNTKRKKK
tara:strand:+ start:675 stop:905 length:231 start_codon:yes stop_codon:yes gene_type:complete